MEHYRKLFGFLSKEYMEEQNDSSPELIAWLDSIPNQDDIFYVTPEVDLTLYEDELKELNTVEEMLETAEADDQPLYLADWKDDDDNQYVAFIYKDDDDEVKVICRSTMYDSLDSVPEGLLDLQWHPCKLKGINKYIWESNEMDPAEFLEAYSILCTKFEESDQDEEVDNENETSE